MNDSTKIRAFLFSAESIQAELTNIGEKTGVEIVNNPDPIGVDQDYYLQFDLSMRNESAQMAKYYEIFYCLEKNARTLVSDVLISSKGSDWFKDPVVPQVVLQEVNRRIEKEIEEGFTKRSEHLIDYTTFGELSQIISANWNDFTSIFKNKKAVERIMARLNNLRSPIAHCCPLAPDEVDRLHLTVRDWFRLI